MLNYGKEVRDLKRLLI